MSGGRLKVKWVRGGSKRAVVEVMKLEGGLWR